MSHRRAIEASIATLIVLVLGVAGTQAQQRPKVAGLALQPDELCAQLTLNEVNQVMGGGFERVQDAVGIFCEYRDAKVRVRYFSLGNSEFSKEAWSKLVIGRGRGVVRQQSGVLVGDYDGRGFGALDEVWFQDRDGHRLYIRVNTQITEEQAVALAILARE